MQQVDDGTHMKKIVSAIPPRDWNIADFYGKYHLSKVANKLTPIPGTQVNKEKKYEEEKLHALQTIEESKLNREKHLQRKLEVKTKSVTLQTQVTFDTTFEEKIRKAEELLNQNEELLMKENLRTTNYLDSESDILKFKQNVEADAHHYVGFAISKGFQSINYCDKETGNSFLHLAVRKGNLKTTEELLKYQCNPDVKNNLGNYPIHEAWIFWSKTHSVDKSDGTIAVNPKKEEREAKEQLTCQLILALLSYNGYVDAQTLSLETPLHIASRLGPIRVVKILLTFKADTELLNNRQQTAIDVSIEFNQNETTKLLSSWEYIKEHIVHADFHIVWHRFLKDSEAIISNDKDAKTILSELELQQNNELMQRMTKQHTATNSTIASSNENNVVLIDDPLLKAALEASKAIDNYVDITNGNSIQGAVLPWTKNWKRFVKEQRMRNLNDLKSKLDQLQAKANTNKKKRKQFTLADKRRNLLPERQTPIQFSHRNIVATELGIFDGLQSIEENNIDADGDENKIGNDTTVNDDQSLASTASIGSSSTSKYNVKRIHAGKMSANSSLAQRRQSYAYQVTKDALFLPFTKRLATDSALSISLRTVEAPLIGTVEEYEIIRSITNQGIEYDRLEKYKKKDVFHDLYNIKRSPRKSHLGNYNEAVECSQLNERDQLYDSLHPIYNTSSGVDSVVANNKLQLTPISSDALSTTKAMSKLKEATKKDKIDLVGEIRPRYVPKELLPAKKELTLIETMLEQQHEKKEKDLLKKFNLYSSSGQNLARQEMERKIAEQQNKIMNSDEDKLTDEEKFKNLYEDMDLFLTNDDKHTRAHSRQRMRNKLLKEQSMEKLFLEDKQVKYGKNRLLSSHNLTGKLEDPWQTVDGRYKTVAGDRTI